MELKEKNKTFQSCRYCAEGGSTYKVIENNEVFYLCEKHKTDNADTKDLLLSTKEEEINYASFIS